MDDGVPVSVQLFGILVAVIINIILYVALWTWLMRDLSYKPLLWETEDFGRTSSSGGDDGADDETENESKGVEEIQLWPLSTRVFFPPRVAPLWLCCCAGIGAQILVTAFFFLLFFRLGIINESLGAAILTPAVIFYTGFAILGGYVTARLYAVMHGTVARALQACFLTASLFPILGIIVFHLVYDVLPDNQAPDYRVISSSVPLILIWIFAIFPLTILGGWLGHRHGPIQNFPLSEGSKGYQDLALQDGAEQDHDAERTCCCWTYGRVPCLFLIGGILPVACSFVEYAYGVAGPVYVGYFSDNSLFAIISFFLFGTCIAGVSALLYYKQVRSHRYDWWWPSFITGASSGFYVFLLSISWLMYDSTHGHSVPKGSQASYTLWFLFGSLAVGFMAGFVAVVSCMLFSRSLYTFLLRRAEREADRNELQLEQQHSSESYD